jgi:hypothetical protein
MDIENTDAVVANDVQVPNLLGTLNAPAAAGASPNAEVKPVAVSKELLKDRRLIILFFDLSSMQPEEIKRASESAQEYVDKQMKPADLVSVVSAPNSKSRRLHQRSGRSSVVHSSEAAPASKGTTARQHLSGVATRYCGRSEFNVLTPTVA